jgi:hypothetical protein
MEFATTTILRMDAIELIEDALKIVRRYSSEGLPSRSVI